ncbi:MAG: ATP-binding cassette domain-containing protein [Planctomycetes bacterium]|nr:ATP-binding cassette domain-containing protein [Planctomycetota bacterium]
MTTELQQLRLPTTSADADSPAAYHVRQVVKSYGRVQAVDVERLDVAAGEVLCLLGPTGAGKSTLLRLLAALEAPTSGEVIFAGGPLGTEAAAAVRRRVTLVFQRAVLLTDTVRANVEYGLKLRGMRGDAASRIAAVLDRLGLAALADRPAATLSGGQTQLVALARALVLEPEVLLLDEPTANLDPARVALVEEVIGEDKRRRGTTVVWATHNMFQARRVADRVALLLSARLVEAAPTEAFFNRPGDPRTADFVAGRMVY